MTTASVLISEKFSHEGKETLRWWRDEFWQWDGRRYKKIADVELESIILKSLEGRIEGLKPRHASEVMKCIRAKCYVPSEVNPPAFVGRDDAPERHDIISFVNGLADIDTSMSAASLIPHTPDWFSMTTLPFEYDPDATCLRWEEFLDESLGDDDSIDLLQRWFGYLLTNDTSHQKLLMLVGPPRAGKGTVVRVMQHVFGNDNVTTPTLASLGGEFGLWPLLGRSIAILPDAHLSARADGMRILETIKSIVGEDSVNVNRKCLPQLSNIRLPVRFVIVVNELPAFADSSGALAARLCILPFPSTFFGKEDRSLSLRLAQEAPGILNWAIEGLKRLRKLGRFNVPDSAADIHENYRRMSSPIHAFLEDCCALGSGFMVTVESLYSRYVHWATENGYKPLAKATFGERLHTANPTISRSRLRQPGQVRHPYYIGVKLLEYSDDGLRGSVPACPQGQTNAAKKERRKIRRVPEKETSCSSASALGTTGDTERMRPHQTKSRRIRNARTASRTDPKGEIT